MIKRGTLLQQIIVTRLRATHDNQMPAGLKAVFSDQ